jgi:hypothetical protein
VQLAPRSHREAVAGLALPKTAIAKTVEEQLPTDEKADSFFHSLRWPRLEETQADVAYTPALTMKNPASKYPIGR